MSHRALRKLTDDSLKSKESEFGAVLEPDISRGILFSTFSLPQTLAEDDVPVEVSEDEIVTGSVPKRKKKKNHKRKTKSAKQSTFAGFEVDDGELTEATSTVKNSDPQPITDLLVSSTKFLDPIGELSRIFGSNVVQNRNSSRKTRTGRGSLVHIKPSWPPIVRFGLEMKMDEDGIFTFTHSKEYQNAQKAFYIALDSMDPNSLLEILAKYPYHIDSLLQLSDVLIQQDNSEMGTDLLERVLHAFQSTFHPSFNPLLGTYRLSYRHQENRGLFVALFRYINVIGGRGCYRCALEYCKILLSLDPENDPLAVLLMIDYYALFSKQFDLLLEFHKRLNALRNLSLLPNFAYSIPLALKLNEKSKECTASESDQILQNALFMFPGFITRLLKHTSIGGISNLDNSLLFGKEVMLEPASLGRLLDLYVVRTHAFWTDANVLPWLEHNVEVVLKSVEPGLSDGKNPDPRLAEYSRQRKSLYRAIPRNVNRHLILADLPEAPPILSTHGRSSHVFNFDPLPPNDSIDIYSPEQERQQTGGFLSSLLLSMIPSYSTQETGHAQNGAGPVEPGQAVRNAAEQLANALRRVLRLDLQPATTEENAGENAGDAQ